LSTKARLARVFVGEGGLRTGWSVLLFGLLLAAAAFGAVRLFPRLGGAPLVATPIPAMLRDATLSLLVLGVTWLMSRIEHRSALSYGLAGSRAFRKLVMGAFWGVVVFSTLIGLLAASGHLELEALALHGSAIAWYGLAWLLVFFLVAFAEENLFRGYLLFRLARGIGFWPAATVLSLGFGLIHLRNSSEVLLGIAGAAIGGMVFSLCLKLTGSLWWGIGFHAAWDWAESFLFGTPNSGYIMKGTLLSSRPVGDTLWSGGTAGPEASMLLLPLLAAALFVVWLLRRRRLVSDEKPVLTT